MISRCYHSVIFVVFEAALCNQAFAQQDVRAITLKQAVDAASGADQLQRPGEAL